MNPDPNSNIFFSNYNNINQINSLVNILSQNLANNLLKIIQNPFNITTQNNNIDINNKDSNKRNIEQNLNSKKDEKQSSSLFNKNIAKNIFQIKRNRKLKENSSQKKVKNVLQEDRYKCALNKRKQNLNNYLMNYRLNNANINSKKNILHNTEFNQLNKIQNFENLKNNNDWLSDDNKSDSCPEDKYDEELDNNNVIEKLKPVKNCDNLSINNNKDINDNKGNNNNGGNFHNCHYNSTT